MANTVSEETRQKMRDSWTPERKAKMSERVKQSWTSDRKDSFASTIRGVPKTDECKSRMSAASKGKLKSDAHRAAMTAAHKQRYEDIHRIQDANQCSYKEALQIYKSE